MKKFNLLLMFTLLIAGVVAVTPTEARTMVYHSTNNTATNKTYVVRNGHRYHKAPNGTYYRGPYRTYMMRNGYQYYTYRATNGKLVTHRV